MKVLHMFVRRPSLSDLARPRTRYICSSRVLESANTVDQNEVDHHTALVNQWWDRNGIMKGLHSMNQLRVPFIRDGLISTGRVSTENVKTSTPLKNTNILDVGCGGGILSERLAKIGANVTGLDPSEELICLAKTHASSDESLSANLRYEIGSIEDFSISNIESFDAVVMSEVLEHITEKELFLKACVKTLKPGGSVFVTTINKTKESWLLAIIMAENVLRLLPKGTHQWEKFIAPHETQRLLENHHCMTKVTHGMFYQFWNDTWIWCGNQDINYALQAIKKCEK